MGKVTYFIYVPKISGGVYDVTSSLANALIEKSFDVVIFSNLKELFTAYFSVKNGFRYSILSLHTGIYAFFFSKSIYIIHGFPVYPYHNRLKIFILNLVPRISRIAGSKVVAVSYFISDYYKKIENFLVDGVIHNGVSNNFIENSKINIHKNNNNQFFYIGLISLNKGIDKFLEAFININKNNLYSFVVAGDGPHLQFLKDKYINHSRIKFLGPINDDEKVNLFFNSEIFVSLNDMEPFGVTYLEAYLSNCKILAPYTFGALEVLPRNAVIERAHSDSLESIKLAMLQLVQSSNVISDKSADFSYKSIVNKYLLYLAD